MLIGFTNDSGPVKTNPSYVRITLDKNDHYPEINSEGIMILRTANSRVPPHLSASGTPAA